MTRVVRNLKMRAESGFWDEIRNGEGAALGLTPAESLAVALRADMAAERITDLAATVAMAYGNCIQIEIAEERGRALLGF